MARYKFVDMSPRLVPVVLEDHLVPGSFAHAVHHLVDALDLSGFEMHFRNDANGATAHAPSMLLKAVLLAYAQGIIRSLDAIASVIAQVLVILDSLNDALSRAANRFRLE